MRNSDVSQISKKLSASKFGQKKSKGHYELQN